MLRWVFNSPLLLNSFRKPFVFALFKSQGPIAAAKDTKEDGPLDSEVSTNKNATIYPKGCTKKQQLSKINT